MLKKSQPELEPQLPIKLDSTSNGEYEPRPLTPEIQLVKQWTMEHAAVNARWLGLSRRQFLMTACGTATTLLCMNQVFGRGGNVGGVFDVNPIMELDLAAAVHQLAGDEFIFDIQTHHVNPAKSSSNFVRFFPQANCGEPNPVDCFNVEHYIKEVFMDSDTSMAVLSAVPAVPGNDPLSTEEAAATRALVEMTSGSLRLQIHGLVVPNIQTEAQLDGMQRLVEQYQIKAWKCYTHFGGPDHNPWFLDDKIGIRFIERAREVGVKLICVHKGLSGNSFNATCRDVGVVATMFPDVTFIIYHSGFEQVSREGAYNPRSTRGIDTLIKSLQDNDVPPNSNVYAEIGTTWRQVMTNPTVAAHVIGKLLKFVGEDRVVWGTDSIWYGSPQDQIEAFRAFQISQQFQEQYGYPALTPEIKAKVFGLNAAVPYGINPSQVAHQLRRDEIHRRKIEYQNNPQPSFSTYGPKTRREFLSFLRRNGGRPG
ncbi:MAG: amidohydrolase family protein [Acidobacteria bacterium]|nr:amidohydrolase family protein [Acidobacteriota bacterium]